MIFAIVRHIKTYRVEINVRAKVRISAVASNQLTSACMQILHTFIHISIQIFSFTYISFALGSNALWKRAQAE